MKKLILVMLIGFSITSANAQFESAELTASGLTCSMCSKAIYKALTKVNSIESVKANIENSSYAIQFKNNTLVDLDAVKNAVIDAGFNVANLQVTTNVNNVDVKKDAHITLGNNTFHFINTNQQNLNGDVTLNIVDKGFLSDSDYKKYAAFTTMKCMETGQMEACCNTGKSGNQRVYHVTL